MFHGDRPLALKVDVIGIDNTKSINGKQKSDKKHDEIEKHYTIRQKND